MQKIQKYKKFDLATKRINNLIFPELTCIPSEIYDAVLAALKSPIPNHREWSRSHFIVERLAQLFLAYLTCMQAVELRAFMASSSSAVGLDKG